MGKRCKENNIGSKSMFRIAWKTHKKTAGEFTDRELSF